jgi:hypothetical protein
MCQVLIVKNIWSAINTGEWWYVVAAGSIYTVFTAEGSVAMMKYLLRSEKGERRVGAYSRK